MGLYTESIKERERNDRELERIADLRMMNRQNDPNTTEDDSGAQLALDKILTKYRINPVEVFGYTSIGEMLDLKLDPFGILYDEVDLTDSSWKKGTDNFLAFLEDGNAVALMPSVLGYKYFCPATGKKGRVTDNIKLMATGYAIQRPIELGNATLLSMAGYILHLVSIRDLVIIIVAGLLVSLLGLVVPRMNVYVLEEVVPMGNDGYSLLMRGLFLFILVGLIRSGISAIKMMCLSRMNIRISEDVQMAVMNRVLMLPQTFFSTTSSGKLSKQISNARFLSNQIISFVMGAALTALFSLVYIPQMATFSVVLLIPALVVLAVKSAFTLIANRFFAENERKRQSADMENRSFLFTTLKGIQRIKESGAEKRIYARWTRRYRAVLSCDLDQPIVLKIENAITGFLSSLTTVLLISLVLPNGIAKADYIAFNSAFAMIAAAVDDLLDANRKIYLMKPMMNQLEYLLETPHENSTGVTVMRKLRGEIAVENVSFSYDESTFGCLRDISFHIEEGEKVAIVGESGCGKSTLLKLILGVLKPVSGGILIDDTPLDTINLRSFRRHIGAVFQFSRVMPGTVYSNIAFCTEPVSREEAKEAAIKADIDETIMRLPLGYDTEISDSNTGGFSGGQRQRLLLARALASKPSILILDEATSALDNLSQSKVLESVYKEKCTVIMVAHRLSTVRECDRIIVLKEGTISETGTFDELMDKKGYFYELMRRQSA